METLTETEINRLLYLVGDKIDTSDFEYQDEDYQKEFQELESKLIRMRLASIRIGLVGAQ